MFETLTERIQNKCNFILLLCEYLYIADSSSAKAKKIYDNNDDITNDDYDIYINTYSIISRLDFESRRSECI